MRLIPATLAAATVLVCAPLHAEPLHAEPLHAEPLHAEPLPAPAACGSATLDADTLERYHLPLPACVATTSCGNEDAKALADWFDEAAKKLEAKFSALPNYYPGPTLNALCTELHDVYASVERLADLDVAAMSPARQQLIEEAANHLRAAAKRAKAREGLSRGERRRLLRDERTWVRERREARALADQRVAQEDAAQAAAAAERARAARSNATAAFERRLRQLIGVGTDGTFSVEGGKHRSSYRPGEDDSLTDLMLWAASEWRRSPGGEAPRSRELERQIAAATGGFELHDLKYDPGADRFEAVIATGNGVLTASGSLALSGASAKEAELRLAASSVIAGLRFSNDRLTLARLALVDRADADPANWAVHLLEFEPSSFDVTPARTTAWRTAFDDAQAREAEQRRVRRAAERRRIAEVYPYEARFTCSLGALHICLGADGAIRVRSGTEAESYTAHDLIGEAWLEISLAGDFDITAQTGSGRGRTLTLEVIDYLTERTLYRESTSLPGEMIRVSD